MAGGERNATRNVHLLAKRVSSLIPLSALPVITNIMEINASAVAALIVSSQVRNRYVKKRPDIAQMAARISLGAMHAKIVVVQDAMDWLVT